MKRTIFAITILTTTSAFAGPSAYDLTQDIAIKSNKNFNDYQQVKIVKNENDIRDLKNTTSRQFDQVNSYVKSVDKARADGDAALGHRIESLENAPKPKDGKDGIDGINGVNGTDGKDGLDGKNGQDGKDGVNGATGSAGRDGVNGLNGKDGRDGVDADMSIINNLAQTSAARFADTDSRIAEQKAQQRKTDATVAAHTQQLADHERRIGDLEGSTNSRFTNMDKRIDENKRNADAGIAGVAAMANIPQVTEGSTFSMGAGAGTREGESAIAVGFSARAPQDVIVKASVAGDTQQSWTVGAGVAYQW